MGQPLTGDTKPDVMADGVSNYIPDATSGNVNGYLTGSGTSFSCPLVAGVAALILQAHPIWTPMQVRDALRNTASRNNNPANDTTAGELLMLWRQFTMVIHYRFKHRL